MGNSKYYICIIVYFILATSYNFQVTNNWSSALTFAGEKTGTFITSTFEGLKQLFTGKAGLDQMMGPVGISEVVAKQVELENLFIC